MSITIIPNSGLFNCPKLDADRAQALSAVHAEGYAPPEALVYYIRALEDRLLSEIGERKRKTAREFWRFDNLPKARP